MHPAVRTPEVLRWLSYFHAAFQARQVSHSCVATSTADIRFRLKRDGFGDWNILGSYGYRIDPQGSYYIDIIFKYI